jgi:hypothetical protein
VAFNTPWNAALAYLSAADIELDIQNSTFEQSRSVARVGEQVGIHLSAPLNLDETAVEPATVQVRVNREERPDIRVKETNRSAPFFRATVPIRAGETGGDADVIQARPGDRITVSYGHGPFERTVTVEVE